ncbi:hypothetical protein ACVWYY_002196 [Thermostichus sp. MS-CIW-34]|jgi:hypothetical protein
MNPVDSSQATAPLLLSQRLWILQDLSVSLSSLFFKFFKSQGIPGPRDLE